MVLLAALAYIGLQPVYAQFLIVDRRPWAEMLSKFPDRRTPAYADLVRKAAETIPEGASVAVLYSTLDWHRGYSYAYFRAQYFLPGRVVIPLGWPTGSRPERIEEATWAIVYGTGAPDGHWTVMLQMPDGQLLQRAR